MKVGTLVAAYWMTIGLGDRDRDWFYGVVVSPLAEGKTTIRWNGGHYSSHSNWEMSQNGIKVLHEI